MHSLLELVLLLAVVRPQQRLDVILCAMAHRHIRQVYRERYTSGSTAGIYLRKLVNSRDPYVLIPVLSACSSRIYAPSRRSRRAVSKQAVLRSEKAVLRSKQAIWRSKQAVLRSKQALSRSNQPSKLEEHLLLDGALGHVARHAHVALLA